MSRQRFMAMGVPCVAIAIALFCVRESHAQHGGGGHGGGGHGGGGSHGGGGHVGGGGGYGGVGHASGGWHSGSSGWHGAYTGGRGYGHNGYGNNRYGYNGFGYNGYGNNGYGYNGYGNGFGFGLGWPGYASYGGDYGAYASDYPYAMNDSSYATNYQNAPQTGYAEESEMPEMVQNIAHVRVLIPADAKLWFNGTETQQTGTERIFATPELTPGRSYKYEIRAQWQVEGKETTQTREVTFHAGDGVTVNMMK